MSSQGEDHGMIMDIEVQQRNAGITQREQHERQQYESQRPEQPPLPPPAYEPVLLTDTVMLIAENREAGRNIQRTLSALEAWGQANFTLPGLLNRERALELS